MPNSSRANVQQDVVVGERWMYLFYWPLKLSGLWVHKLNTECANYSHEWLFGYRGVTYDLSLFQLLNTMSHFPGRDQVRF